MVSATHTPDPPSPSPSSREPVGPEQTLSDEDIEAAFQRVEKRDHPVDARLSVPLPGKRRAYVVVLGGLERRNETRRQRDRERHPLLTLGNVLALAAVVAVIYAFSLVAMVAFNGMLPLT